MKIFAVAFIPILLMHFPFAANIDLAVEWIKVDRSVVFEGEIVEIKAKVVNLGENTPFTIYFYYDRIDGEHFIDFKYYDSIKNYRLPSIKFDTKNKEGKHIIIAHVIDENTENNYAYCNLTVLKAEVKRDVFIKELYYNCYPNRNNEYICIYNAGGKTNLDEWYITNTPHKRADEQNKIILNFEIDVNESIYITQNGGSFEKEAGFNPDFEYYDCSSIPNLERKGKFILSNEGGVVCLKDRYNHTIDVVVYGNASFHEGWTGKGITGVKQGVVLRRNDAIDTNTSKDWENNRTYKIGQSDFKAWHGKADRAIAFCSPDCSFDVIANELKDASKLLINMYIFTNPFIAKILNESDAEIKIYLDGNVYGGIPLEEKYIAYMLDKKAEVRFMLSNEKEGIYKRYRYNHAKYVVINDKKCIIESANWAKSGIPIDNSYGNREWGIVIEDENLSKALATVFYYDWNPLFQDSVEFNESSLTHGKPKNFTISYFIPKGNYKAKFSPFCIEDRLNVTLIEAPDNAENEILNLLADAKKEILVQQAYIEKEWNNGLNPFLKELIKKNESGVAVKLILDGTYETNRERNGEIINFLKSKGIEAKYGKICIHNKGVIVDGKKVLISSINWGENSVRRNREIGVIVENDEIAEYFRSIFYYDWNYEEKEKGKGDVMHTLIILAIFILTILIILAYRKRK